MNRSHEENSELYALYESLRTSEGRGVLATVVRTSGSTYRRAGARMLVAGDGRSAGLISGGCLESDLRERSGGVLKEGTPALVTYDSASPGDILWGLGLGCPGIAHVLLERVSGGEECTALEFIERCRRLGSPGAIATIYSLSGNTGETAGSRACLRAGESAGESVPESALERRLRLACGSALSAGRSSYQSIQIPGGKAEAFIEYVPPPVSLTVFGAGPDAVPLVRMAAELGWHVTVADGRSAYLKPEFFPTADRLLLVHPGEAGDACNLPRGGAAVVMTHNFDHDTVLIRSFLGSAAAYIGLLGPRAKADLVLGRLAEEGILPTDEQSARLHAPVGLDIGAETPEEIALAIIAEIQAALHDGTGAPLRTREGPIHR